MRTVLLIVQFLFGLTLSACSNNDNPPPKLEIKESQINFNQNASTRVIAVDTNIKDWSVSIPTSASEWLSAKTDRNSLELFVKENNNYKERSTDIIVLASNLRKIIKITQLGKESNVLLESPIINVSGKEQTFKQVITSDEQVNIDIPESVSWISLSDNYTDENENQVFVFFIESNTKAARSIQIKVLKPDDIEVGSFTVNQTLDEGYTGNGGEDILSDIKINVVSGATDSFQPNSGNIENSFDGDYTTVYHSNWNNKGNNYFPITLEYTLEESEQLDYIIYYPRTSGNNGNFKEVDIYVSTTDNTSYKKIKSIDFKGSNSPKKIVLDNPISKPYKVKFVVKSGAGDGQGFASASEIEFYQINPDNYNPLQIFKDFSLSELKDDITLDVINQIDNELYKNIAYRLFKGDYPSEFRIQRYKAWPNPTAISPIIKSNTYSLLDNPTGIYVEKDDILIIGVDDTYNNEISIKIQNLDKSGGDGYGQASLHVLSKGINKIENHEEGLIYVLYHTPNYANTAQPKIHFATGKVNGYFDSQKHSDDEWARLLNAATYKYFDVLGEKAHLTFETSDFRTYAGDDGYKLINQYDNLVRDEQEFLGFYKYNKIPQNRAYFHVMYTSYMYSTSYRTAYNKSTVNTILNYDSFINNIWGPAHELGHTHQVSPAFKWAGMTEVSNNVLSEYIQTKWLGYNKSRLDVEDLGRYNNRYEKGFYQSFVNNTIHAEEPDVFVKLIPFWQLQLIMSEVKGQKDFYKDLYEALRNNPNTSKGGKAQLNYVMSVIEVSKIDFTEFFEAWGLLTPINLEIEDYGTSQFTITQKMIDDVKNKIERYNYPKINSAFKYITDSNFNIFKNKNDIQEGSFETNGSTLIFKNWKNVIAYEVYNGEGNLIFASPKARFKLDESYKDNMKVYAISWNGSKILVN